ncbi:MAG TPA: pseudouridine synthase [Candidatus Marinimicrobia bacterium]|nr:pseudouridine synthase [Candidatus Neomarinimicrobiota bacterium]HRS51649.1 pseudouridine synthase [Candidatus Neomarinimicrobiota bacterium]HRU92201.1 pseudouridine synthase [Candidatus Neomarinimicrobiota bacterium]
MRLNRFLAQAGLGSRRKCESLIRAGRVEINGNVVNDLATQVKETDQVTVDGRRIIPLKPIYILLNKPAGYITTMHDQFGRKTVTDFVNNTSAKPVGRLDMATTGVLLLTNDGELAYRLTHPKFAIERTYRATIAGNVPADIKNQITKGIAIGKGQQAYGRILAIKYLNGYTNVTVELKEGQNREVRRIFAVLRYKVISLDRISFAGVRYSGLERGQWRNLNENEVQQLKILVGITD